MAEETESSSSSSTGLPPQGGQHEQEQQEAQHSSSGGSNNEEGHIINEENNKNDENESIFVVDHETTAKFGLSSKVTVSKRRTAMFGKSRQVADKVSASRSLDLVDKVLRKGNGKSALDVVTPLKLGKNQMLVMIKVDHRQSLKGIVYDWEKGTVTCSDIALSTICKDAGGLATLDSAEVKIIDELLAEFLGPWILDTENTKSAEGEKEITCTCLQSLIYCIFIMLQTFGRNWRRVR